MPIVLAYGRVSSERQADAGALERQEQSLLKESGADEVITDVGSGTNTNRPGYQRMLELIKAGQVSKIVVADQDRLNRQVAADLELWSLCEQPPLMQQGLLLQQRLLHPFGELITVLSPSAPRPMKPQG